MQYPLLLILAVVLAALQIFAGGISLAYALPGYCLLAVAGLGALGYPGRNECATTRLPCVLAALLLITFIALRSWWSPIAHLARPDFFLILGAAVVYLLTTNHLCGSRQRLGIVWGLFFIALLHIVVGAVQFKRQDDWMLLPWIFRPVFFYRASGFYLTPNHLCGLLEMLGPVLLSICIWARGPFAMRAFAAYGYLACLGGITLSGSRMGLISIFGATLLLAGISLAFVFHMRRREFWSVTLVAGSIFVVVMAAAFFFMARSEVLAERLGDFSGSENARLVHAKAAYRQFKLNPDFGTGAGTYVLFGRQLRDRTPASDPAHVHNDYLELLAEYGLAGGALVTLFLGVHLAGGTYGLRRVILRKLRHGSRTKSNEMALLAGAISGLAAVLIHSMTADNLHVPANALFAAFLFGIVANPTADSPATRLLSAHRWLRFVAPALGLLLFVKVVPHLWPEVILEQTRVAARAGEHEEVIALAERGKKADPYHPEFYAHRGEAQARLALLAFDAAERETLLRSAIASFQEGVKLFPQDSRLWAALGRTHDQLGEFDLAEQSFRQAFALEPNSADLYAIYGIHWQLQNQLAKASECFERARILRGGMTPAPAKRRAAIPIQPALPPLPVEVAPAPAPPLPAATPRDVATPAPDRPQPSKRPTFFTD